MNVRVLFFGPLVDITGASLVRMSLPDGATVQNLLTAAFDRWPELKSWDASLLTAVNLTYVRREEIIPPDAEAAIMPPVQGG